MAFTENQKVENSIMLYSKILQKRTWPNNLMSPRHPLPLLTLFLSTITLTLAQNLLCNPNFQSYPVSTPTLLLQTFIIVKSNYSCWYNKNGGVIEIKRRKSPVTTKFAQLVTTTKYVLCQNVTLQCQKEYEIGFAVVNCPTMSYSTIKVTVNGNSLINHTTFNGLNMTNTTKRFIAPSNNTKICFGSDFKILDTRYAYSGPGIDNVTVTKIQSATQTVPNTTATALTPTPSTTTVFNSSHNTSSSQQTIGIEVAKQIINIGCLAEFRYEESKIYVTCRREGTEFQYYLQMLVNCFQVRLEGKIEDLVEFPYADSDSLLVTLTPTSPAFNLNSITITITENQVTQSLPQFNFQVSGLPATILRLSQAENSTLESVSGFSDDIMTSTQKIYAILKSCAASYFLISIISFWNLSLMYNVLSISTVPAFSKLFLQRLTFLFFNLNSISEWLQKNIPGLNDFFSLTQLQGRELLLDRKNEFSWFGAFGLSSWFLTNNAENIFIFFLLIAKLSLLTLLRKLPFFSHSVRNRLPRGLGLLEIFLFEMVSLQTFMIVSAGTVMIDQGFLTTNQKINDLLQTVTVWFSLMLLALYFIVSVELEKKAQRKKSRQNNSETQKKSEKQTETKIQATISWKQIDKRIVVTELNDLFELLPIVVVPLMILLDSPSAFLVVTSILLFGRAVWFLRHRRQLHLPLDQKFFTAFNIGFWTVLQLTYIVLWLLEAIIGQGSSSFSEKSMAIVYYCIRICGYLSIFAVLGGGLFELLRFAIRLLKFSFKTLRKLYQRYTKQNTIKNHRQVHKKPRIYHPNPNKPPIMHITSKQLSLISRNPNSKNKKSNNLKMTVKLKNVDNDVTPSIPLTMRFIGKGKGQGQGKGMYGQRSSAS